MLEEHYLFYLENMKVRKVLNLNNFQETRRGPGKIRLDWEAPLLPLMLVHFEKGHCCFDSLSLTRETQLLGMKRARLIMIF